MSDAPKWQRCPICEGAGVVQNPPGVPAHQSFHSTSLGPWPCPTCEGRRIIPAPGEAAVLPQLRDNPPDSERAMSDDATKLRPFANGSECADWMRRNCDHCTRVDCKMADAIAEGTITGVVPVTLARRYGPRGLAGPEARTVWQLPCRVDSGEHAGRHANGRMARFYNVGIGMTDDLLDSDGYPTEYALEKLRTWSPTDPRGWLEFARSLWWMRDWGWPALEGEVSTGGWSGNESIIRAMQEACLLWHQVWWQTRRGGHYLLSMTDRAHPDTARLDKLFVLLPFEQRHRFGGDLSEFRAGIDAAYVPSPQTKNAPEGAEAR